MLIPKMGGTAKPYRPIDQWSDWLFLCAEMRLREEISTFYEGGTRNEQARSEENHFT